jgi:hypothetical protein
MEIASFVIACVSALGTLFASLYARGQKKAAVASAAIADAAKEEARRAADAAAEMAEIERARRAEEVTAAERDHVRFILEPVGGPRYLLRNDGTASAFGVHVETGDLAYEGHVADIEEFPAGDCREYFLERSVATGPDAHVLVTWYRHRDRSDMRRSQKLYGP